MTFPLGEPPRTSDTPLRRVCVAGDSRVRVVLVSKLRNHRSDVLLVLHQTSGDGFVFKKSPIHFLAAPGGVHAGLTIAGGGWGILSFTVHGSDGQGPRQLMFPRRPLSGGPLTLGACGDTPASLPFRPSRNAPSSRTNVSGSTQAFATCSGGGRNLSPIHSYDTSPPLRPHTPFGGRLGSNSTESTRALLRPLGPPSVLHSHHRRNGRNRPLPAGVPSLKIPVNLGIHARLLGCPIILTSPPFTP